MDATLWRISENISREGNDKSFYIHQCSSQRRPETIKMDIENVKENAGTEREKKRDNEKRGKTE